MERVNLTQFDDIPESMLMYLRHNGPHFNRKLLEFALSKMYKKDTKGKKESINPYTKEQVKETDTLLLMLQKELLIQRH